MGLLQISKAAVDNFLSLLLHISAFATKNKTSNRYLEQDLKREFSA